MASSIPTIPSNEILLLQKEIFTEYLEPLLKIHNHNHNQQQQQQQPASSEHTSNVITYEDLTSSFQLAVAKLGQTNITNIDVNGKNFVRQKLIALHQSQIQAYHLAAKKALTEWANHVSLPEINPTIHDTLSSYVKSCRAVTIATRPIWREPTVSLSSKTNTNTKKELPVNEMAMNIIEERAKAAFEKQQQVSLSTTKNTTMGNIPEGDEEDEEGEVDEGDMNDDDVITEDAVAASTKTTTTTAVATKSSVPTRKNISLTKKSTGAKPNLQQQQQQQQLPPPSKRSTTKTIPIKKTNVTKTTTTTLQQQHQQHRNHPSQSSSSTSSHNNNNARGGGGGGRGSSSNNNSNTNSGGRGGGIRGMGGGRGSGSVSGSGKS